MLALLRVRTARPLSRLRLGSTRSLSSLSHPRFRPSQFDDIEYVEDYRPGGFHPTSIGDTFAQGRYRVVHKLGIGGSSTIWLARNRPGKLVTLKVMRADASSKPVDEVPELATPRKLAEYVGAKGGDVGVACSHIHTPEDHFVEHGPNGSHLCLVSQFAGPSVQSMLDCPGRVSGSRRLRKDLAREVAKQVACTVSSCTLLGSSTEVYLTTSNILFRLAESVQNWSDSDVYVYLGEPETEAIQTREGSPPGPHTPAHLVAPSSARLTDYSPLLQEDILLTDFGQSFSSLRVPADYEPATVPHDQSPEALFERRIGLPSDVWALACTIFEIRAGFPLFEAFLGVDGQVLKEMVATLGKLPEPWWGAFENRRQWFDEDGQPKALELQDVLLPADKTSVQQKLASIGEEDTPPASGYDGPMMEWHGARLDEVEIRLLGDLLGKMLRYRPQERITTREVVAHPWFSLE